MAICRARCLTKLSFLIGAIAAMRPLLAMPGGAGLVIDHGAPPPRIIPKDRLFDLFAAACENGNVVLKPGEATPLMAPNIPHELSIWYNDTKNTKFYRIDDDNKQSYLITFDGTKVESSYKSGCALATTAYNFVQLWVYAAKRPYGKDLQPGSLTRLQLVSPHDKYAIEAQDVGKFGVLQVAMLNDVDAAKLQTEAIARYAAYLKKHPEALPLDTSR